MGIRCWIGHRNCIKGISQIVGRLLAAGLPIAAEARPGGHANRHPMLIGHIPSFCSMWLAQQLPLRRSMEWIIQHMASAASLVCSYVCVFVCVFVCLCVCVCVRVRVRVRVCLSRVVSFSVSFVVSSPSSSFLVRFLSKPVAITVPRRRETRARSHAN